MKYPGRNVVSVCFCLLAFVSCSKGPAQRHSSTPPSTIASLAPNLSEITCDLGECDKIIAVSDFDTYPPALKSKPKLGGLLNPNLEELARLQPQLLLVHPSSTKTVTQAKAMGIETLAVNTDTLDQIYGAYKTIGARLGREQKARERVTAIDAALRGLAHKRTSPPRVLLLVGRSRGTLSQMIAAGRETYLGDLLDKLGAVNVAPQGKNPWPEVNKEHLVDANPDLIIELRGEYESPDDKGAWKKLPALKAVKEDKIVVLRGEHLLIPGSRLVETAKALNGALAHVDQQMMPLGAPSPNPLALKEPGWPLPSFKAPTLDGEEVTLSKGPLFVNIWATWCGPCRKELPVLESLHEEYGPKGVAFVGIATDQESDRAAIEALVKEHKVTYPVLLDPQSQSEQLFGVDALPASFLFDATGRLLWARLGPVHAGEQGVKDKLDQAVKGVKPQEP